MANSVPNFELYYATTSTYSNMIRYMLARRAPEELPGDHVRLRSVDMSLGRNEQCDEYFLKLNPQGHVSPPSPSVKLDVS